MQDLKRLNLDRLDEFARRAGKPNWKRVSDDVRPFLVMQQEAELLTKEDLIRSLGSG
ncbi:MAG TPA: hypothetical protein VJ022_02360 [Anaerolineales bacterium]|nr:hypothetical protein [Anaerolineales bacterium]